MELKDIVAVSGQSGLHKIIGRTKGGLILETIGSGKRFSTSMQDRVSVLDDISMYTNNEDLHLSKVLVKMKEASNMPDAKDDVKKQRQFLIDTIELDSERVYDSDVKKLFTWFALLQDILDFEKLKEERQEDPENTENSEEGETHKVHDGHGKAPKAVAPKNVNVKTNTKGAGAKATTYRPKSG